MTLSFEDILTLMIGSVDMIPAQEFVNQCRRELDEIPYVDFGLDSTLPQFDSGYKFSYPTHHNETAQLEILEKDGGIFQIGIQILYKPSFFFSKIKKDYGHLVHLLTEYYGSPFVSNVANIEVLDYKNDKTLCYTFKVRGWQTRCFNTSSRKQKILGLDIVFVHETSKYV